MLFETPLQSRERKYRETVSLVLKGIAFFMLLRFTIYFAASVLLLLMRRGVLPEVPYDVLNSLTMRTRLPQEASPVPASAPFPQKSPS